MYPHERSLVQKMANKPFVLLGVNSDKDRVKLKQTIKDQKLAWRSFWNGPNGTSGPISAAWNVHAWPTLYLIDHKGTIRYKNLRNDDLDRALEVLVKEAEAK